MRFTHDTESGFFGWLFNVLTFAVIPLEVAGGFLPLNCLKTKAEMGLSYSCATGMAVIHSSRANLDKKLPAQRALIDCIDPARDKAFSRDLVSESSLLSWIPEGKSTAIIE